MLEPADELLTLLAGIGVTPESEVISYWQGGVRAALATIVLKALRFDRARNFDGSFRQWSRDERAPIER